ncbi:MAG TPA: EamA family transporter [Candidatus Woesearchaeota archaeon]|jgi:drug/metabolite transporter (DMT)-like permease|nr:EamA family transporter [Candidatus Woesearchaeota archaeon]HJN56511.1 EamA family transporter [Candidatus Woesearchaeota archaeon]|tara:strand:+ start:3637 stop:4530 length:894 start_codon:yes stop_codon:yes gene_type:complete
MIWILFAAISALLWALTSNFDKFFVHNKKIRPFILAIFNGIFGLIALLLIPFFGLEIFSPFNLFLAFLTGFLYIAFLLPYYKACEYEEISRVIILWKMSPVFVLITSAIFLGEFLTKMDFIGFIFLLSAGILISKKKNKKHFYLGIAFYLLLLSSLISSFRVTIDRFLYSSLSIISVYIWTRIGVFLASMILLIFFWKGFKDTFNRITIRDKSALAFKSLIDLIGLFTIGIAISIAKAPLVSAAINALMPTFTFLFAIIFTIKLPGFVKEDISREKIIEKLIAIALVFIGIYFLYMG